MKWYELLVTIFYNEFTDTFYKWKSTRIYLINKYLLNIFQKYDATKLSSGSRKSTRKHVKIILIKYTRVCLKCFIATR